jgi:hypothetical protein
MCLLLQSLAERLAALEDSRLPALDARIDAVASAGPSQVRLRIRQLPLQPVLLSARGWRWQHTAELRVLRASPGHTRSCSSADWRRPEAEWPPLRCCRSSGRRWRRCRGCWGSLRRAPRPAAALCSAPRRPPRCPRRCVPPLQRCGARLRHARTGCAATTSLAAVPRASWLPMHS